MKQIQFISIIIRSIHIPKNRKATEQINVVFLYLTLFYIIKKYNIIHYILFYLFEENGPDRELIGDKYPRKTFVFNRLKMFKI